MDGGEGAGITFIVLLMNPDVSLAIQRSKELNKENYSEFDLLLLRQSYFSLKVLKGNMNLLGELKGVQLMIS